MQRVILLGEMGERFGETWEMHVDYIKDIFKLIECQRKGFREYLMECHENGTDFTMQRGKEFVGEEELLLSVGNEDIIITPIPAGSKSGIGKILAAIAIVVIAIVAPPLIAAAGVSGTAAAGTVSITAGMAAMAGSTFGMMAISMAASLALAGINQMMMPGPEIDKETPDNYLFNGTSEHIKEGLPIPLCYGEMMVGGGLINQTMTTRRIVSQGMRRSHAGDGSGDFNNTVDVRAGGAL
tara:strand:- start:549 stop:1265 length:717 start_codon:yes stop_codon:yes gene_type:complete